MDRGRGASGCWPESQTLARISRSQAEDDHGLPAAAPAPDQREPGDRHAEKLRQVLEQFTIGPPIGRRSGDPDLECVSVHSRDAAAGGARLHVKLQLNPAGYRA